MTGREYGEIVLERVRLKLHHVVPKEYLDTELRMDIKEQARVAGDDVAIRISLLLYGTKSSGPSGEVYEHADGWWQAFRERWFPAFWLRRYPVRKKRVDIGYTWYRVCPHINPPSGDRVHIVWLNRPGMPGAEE